MKIIFFGDSVTDANRERGSEEAGRVKEVYSDTPKAYGSGYVFLIAAQLFYEKPNFYQILNRGIAGDRLPQMYARIQLDIWSEQPDVLSIFVGANDAKRRNNPNYTDLERWGRLYRTMIRETQERCPQTKIMICETYDLRSNQDIEYCNTRKAYADEAKKIADEFNLPFVPVQEAVDKAVERYGLETCFYDRAHPNLVGSKVIADEWLKVFKKEIMP